MFRPSSGNDDERKCKRLIQVRALLIYGNEIPLWADSVEPLCEHCGQRRIEEHHHRLFRSHGGLWVASNIIGLCSLCHRAATIEPDWGYSRGLDVPSHGDPLAIPVQTWYHREPVLLDDAGGYTICY